MVQNRWSTRPHRNLKAQPMPSRDRELVGRAARDGWTGAGAGSANGCSQASSSQRRRARPNMPSVCCTIAGRLAQIASAKYDEGQYGSDLNVLVVQITADDLT